MTLTRLTRLAARRGWIALLPATLAVASLAGCKPDPSASENTTKDVTKPAARQSLVVKRESTPMSGKDIDEGETDDALDAQIRSGHAIGLPRFALAEPADIARGKEVFLRQGCPKCHGPDGEGDGDVYLIDGQRHPIRPRNLVYGPFKGGHEPEAIYVRLRLGMPGSPMPANVNLGEQGLVDLVHYCRSLSREPKRHSTNYQRAIHAISPPIQSTSPSSGSP